MVDLKEKVKELSDIERKLLSSLSHELSGFENLSVVSGVSIDSVRRAAAWLSQKGFAVVLEKETERFYLTPEGENALSKGMPENILLETLTRLGGKASFVKLERESVLSKQEFMAALGINKRKAFVVIMQGQIQETGLAKEQEFFLGQNFLRDVVDSKNLPEHISLELLKRGLIEKKKTIKRTIKISSDGLIAKDLLSTQSIGRVYDVEAPVPVMYLGRRTPYSEFIYSIRKKLVSFGFSEMDYSMIVPEFYNFDVLYQPQNHPARTWSDTYQLKNPQFGLLPDKKVVSAIKAAHENGGVSGSKGWGYKWDEKIASRLMPASHTTAQSARQLVKGIKVPGKYFIIGRCFRPDVLDATHLIEFNQTEGFVVGEDINFRHLLGMLKEFAIEFAGAEKVKFIPDYFPFTEPSVQLSAKHPELGWIELGGAGMFRPEMIDNLGINAEVIAWGIGIDRLAMFKLGLNDIRYLFSDNLSYLRNAKGVMH